MDQRLAKWGGGLQALDLGQFALAAELESEAQSGSWKEYSFSLEYPLEARQGKHPSSFGAFLEGLSFDLREQGHDCSRGVLEDTLEVYRWGTALGLTLQVMAYLGLELLKRIHRLGRGTPDLGAQLVADAYASKQQFGKVHLPSFEQPERVTFSVETEDMGDGTYQLRALVVTKGGVRHSNRWPKELLHYLCKRLRASNVTRG
jgi:hypothetical protein